MNFVHFYLGSTANNAFHNGIDMDISIKSGTTFFLDAVKILAHLPPAPYARRPVRLLFQRRHVQVALDDRGREAHDGRFVVSWYMARPEASRAWEALMTPIPAPDEVVCDGGTGFEKVGQRAWPRTRVQRCLFPAFSQARRYTTSRPLLQAGRESYNLALELMRLETLRQAEW